MQAVPFIVAYQTVCAEFGRLPGYEKEAEKLAGEPTSDLRRIKKALQGKKGTKEQEVFQQALKLAPTPLPANVQRMSLSKESAHTKIIVHVKAGQLEKAEALFEGMQRRGIRADTVAYSAMIHGYVQAGQMEKAEALLEELKGNGLQRHLKKEIYETMIAGFTTAGQMGKAEQLREEMNRVYH